MKKHFICTVPVVACLAIFLCSGCDGGGGDDGNDTVEVLHETCGSDLCASPPTCGPGEVLTCCTCVKVPSQTAVVTTCDLISEYCAPSATPVDVSCYMEDGWPTGQTPRDVTAHGPVDVYATGPGSDDILVEIYNVDEEGNIGTLVGSYTSDTTCADQEAAGLFPTQHESVDEAADCPGPCVEKISPDNHDCRNLGYYVVENVPTNTPLIVKTSQASGTGLWKDMLSFNIWFFDGEIETHGGTDYVFYKARVVSEDDWRNIPVAAGDTNGVAPGYGAIAGEIHDCADNRLSFAMAATFPEANTLTYFNGVEEKLYPNLSRSAYGTNHDGLYAAIEMDAESSGSAVWVSALADVEAVGVVSLGWQKAFVYPDTLTSVTLRGTRPDQVN